MTERWRPDTHLMLDTDTLSELCRGNLRVAQHARSYLNEFGRLTISAITVFERLRGYRLAIRKGKPFHHQMKSFQALAANCIVLPFDQDAAAVSAQMWAGVSRATQRRMLGDILIAAVAVSRNLPLVTRNKRDFERLASAAECKLTLLDWTMKNPN